MQFLSKLILILHRKPIHPSDCEGNEYAAPAKVEDSDPENVMVEAHMSENDSSLQRCVPSRALVRDIA